VPGPDDRHPGAGAAPQSGSSQGVVRVLAVMQSSPVLPVDRHEQERHGDALSSRRS
jgi:hypothetical protein